MSKNLKWNSKRKEAHSDFYFTFNCLTLTLTLTLTLALVCKLIFISKSDRRKYVKDFQYYVNDFSEIYIRNKSKISGNSNLLINSAPFETECFFDAWL